MVTAALQAGRITYTNDLPIYAAYDTGACEFPGVLHADVPERLNARMLSGELAMGPVSAFAYLANRERFALLPDLCIGARTAVWSVLLVSETPPEHLDDVEIVVTAESASGRNLLRVLLEGKLRLRPRYRVVADPLAVARTGRPALLIGDSAITARMSVPAAWVYDLGTLWHAWTGCDSVFAVWVARKEALQTQASAIAAALKSLRDAYAWGRANMPEVITLAQQIKPQSTDFYKAYYAALHFELDAQALHGLTTYARELHAIGALPAPTPLVPEVLECHLPAY